MASIPRLALALCIGAVASAHADDQKWTAQDLDHVADAATSTLMEYHPSTIAAGMLVELSDALSRAGDASRSKDVLVKAASLLDPPKDYMSSTPRGSIVEKLAQFGDLSDATALASVEAPSEIKAMLLGKLGAGQARIGNLEGAKKAASEIARLVWSGEANPPSIIDPRETAISEIGLALVDVGDSVDAGRLAEGLRNGPPKLRVLDKMALFNCRSIEGKVANVKKGQEVTELAVNFARITLNAPDLPFAKFDIMVGIADAVTTCDGPAKAKAFLEGIVSPDISGKVLSRLADQLIARGDVALARTILPPPDLTDAGELIGTASQLVKMGDRPAALKMALDASRIAVNAAGGPSGETKKVFQYIPLLGQIFDVLTDLEAYDAAIATVQPIDFANRQQFYERALRAAIWKKDDEAINHLLPITMAVFKETPPPLRFRVRAYLYEFARDFALAGSQHEASKLYAELMALASNPAATVMDRIPPWQLATLKADLGDIPGALQTANDAGPMVTNQNGLQLALVTAMQFDNAKHPPTEPEIAEAMKRSKEVVPALVPGPKAVALSSIASDLATLGDIEGALQVEALLNAERSEAIKVPHDNALSAIATAQIKAGDVRGAFLTAQRITQPLVRSERFLKLAGTAPR